MDDRYKSRTMRILMIYIFICIIFLLLLIKMFSYANIGINVRDSGRKKIDFRNISSNDRLKITDRNGLVIATNVRTYAAYTNPKLINNPEELAQQLCQAINGLNHTTLLKKLSNQKSSFVWIKKNMTPDEKEKIINMGIPGVFFEDSNTRIYPLKNLFSHIIGAVNVDGLGVSGFEFFIDNNLSHDTKMQEKYIDIENNTIRTSLDARLQEIFRNELLSAVNKYHAKGGVGMILNIDTGEVLSILSLPDFDPNHLSLYDDVAKFNKATLGVYEIGSIMKIFTIAATIDAGVVKIDDVFDVGNPYKLDKFMINDFHKGKSFLTTTEIFTKSSNIGMAKIADTIDPILQFEFFKEVQLLSPLTIEVPEKGVPIYPKNWNKITSISSSYGYSIATSFVHLGQSIASLLNGGYHITATILPNNNNGSYNDIDNEIEHNGGDHELCKQGYVPQNTIIKKETYSALKSLLLQTVTTGTARRARIMGYDFLGKTGTAMKNNGRTYDRDRNITSFVAIFPAKTPKYLIIAMLDEPNKISNEIITGGTTIAPLVKVVIQKSLPILGILPNKKNLLRFENIL